MKMRSDRNQSGARSQGTTTSIQPFAGGIMSKYRGNLRDKFGRISLSHKKTQPASTVEQRVHVKVIAPPLKKEVGSKKEAAALIPSNRKEQPTKIKQDRVIVERERIVLRDVTRIIRELRIIREAAVSQSPTELHTEGTRPKVEVIIERSHVIDNKVIQDPAARGILVKRAAKSGLLSTINVHKIINSNIDPIIMKAEQSLVRPANMKDSYTWLQTKPINRSVRKLKLDHSNRLRSWDILQPHLNKSAGAETEPTNRVNSTNGTNSTSSVPSINSMNSINNTTKGTSRTFKSANPIADISAPIETNSKIVIDTSGLTKKLTMKGRALGQAQLREQSQGKTQHPTIREHLNKPTARVEGQEQMLIMANEQERKLSVKVEEQERKLSVKVEEQERKLGVKVEEQERKLSTKAEEQERKLSTKVEEQERKLSVKVEEQERKLSTKAEEQERKLSVKAEEQVRKLSTKVEEQERKLSVKAEEQERKLSAKVEEQERKLSVKAEKQERKLSAKAQEQERKLSVKAEEQEQKLSANTQEQERKLSTKIEEQTQKLSEVQASKASTVNEEQSREASTRLTRKLVLKATELTGESQQRGNKLPPASQEQIHKSNTKQVRDQEQQPAAQLISPVLVSQQSAVRRQQMAVKQLHNLSFKRADTLARKLANKSKTFHEKIVRQMGSPLSNKIIQTSLTARRKSSQAIGSQDSKELVSTSTEKVTGKRSIITTEQMGESEQSAGKPHRPVAHQPTQQQLSRITEWKGVTQSFLPGRRVSSSQERDKQNPPRIAAANPEDKIFHEFMLNRLVGEHSKNAMPLLKERPLQRAILISRRKSAPLKGNLSNSSRPILSRSNHTFKLHGEHQLTSVLPTNSIQSNVYPSKNVQTERVYQSEQSLRTSPSPELKYVMHAQSGSVASPTESASASEARMPTLAHHKNKPSAVNEQERIINVDAPKELDPEKLQKMIMTMPQLNPDTIADQVYKALERKMKLEQRRRGY
ncbi:MAG: hypothetical protein ACE3L7_04605 [Candidatus Pristimantibacillus sp.]